MMNSVDTARNFCLVCFTHVEPWEQWRIGAQSPLCLSCYNASLRATEKLAMSKPATVDQPDSRRVFAYRRFAAEIAPFIDYGKIAEQARQIGGHFTVINCADGSVEITTYWDSTIE